MTYEYGTLKYMKKIMIDCFEYKLQKILNLKIKFEHHIKYAVVKAVLWVEFHRKV